MPLSTGIIAACHLTGTSIFIRFAYAPLLVREPTTFQRLVPVNLPTVIIIVQTGMLSSPGFLQPPAVVIP